MADINLTAADDTYTQLDADRDLYNNIYGLAGNDTIKLIVGTAIGGAGNDVIEQIPIPGQAWRQVGAAYWNSPSGIVANLAEGWIDDGWGTRDTVVGILMVHGSGQNDRFIGGPQDNFFQPNGGRDQMDGGAGIDGFQVREIPPTADGKGTYRPARMEDLDIKVAPDGRSATVAVKYYPQLTYTVTNMEYFTLMETGSPRYYLADFIKPQDMAEQAIAAGGDMRWNANGALGSSTALSYSFVTQAPAGGVGAVGFRAFSAAEQQTVRDILAKTSALAGITFVELTESGAVTGQMRFGVSQQAATKGVSWLPNQSGAGALAGDVWMDVESMVALSPGSEGHAALLHEIGHALGLRHPRNVDAGDAWPVQLRESDDRSALTVMSAAASPDGLFRAEWGSLDVLALRYLYGTRMANLGDTRHVLGARAGSAQTTLIDDGGNDTLDASAVPIGVSLDLTSGRLSSAGLSAAGVAGVDNLVIGATSLIEAAIGSAFDDVLLGNALDNHLTGGTGNDWLDGGPGLDTAVFSGRRSDYEVSNSYGNAYVKGRDGVAGLDTLVGIERLQFADQVVTLSATVLAGDLSFSVDEDASVSVMLPTPSDVARSAVSYRIVGAPRHGNATLTAEGALTYAPAANYFGADSVTFDILGATGSNRYLAFVSALPINDGAPVGRNGDYLAQASALFQSRLPKANDIDNDVLIYSLLTEPASGAASISANGEFSYQSNPGFSGTDAFTFNISDGMGGSVAYSARLTVAGVNLLYRGTDAADTFTGLASSDGYTLLGGNDRVTGGGGGDMIDGGDGMDVARYAGKRENFAINNAGTHWTINDSTLVEGNDRLVAIERLQFADRWVALDLEAGSLAGQAAQVIRALFGAATLKVAEYNGYAVVLQEQGMSYADLVALAISTPAFLAKAGSRSNTDFVQLVYKNVVGFAPPVDELNYFVGLLDSGQLTQQSLGLKACQTPINTGSVDLVGLANLGLEYIPPPELT